MRPRALILDDEAPNAEALAQVICNAAHFLPVAGDADRWQVTRRGPPYVARVGTLAMCSLGDDINFASAMVIDAALTLN